MKRAVKYIYEGNPFYVHFKKHLCPQCKRKVELKFLSKIINSKSKQAKDYDFSVGDTYCIGDVEFRIASFYCSTCKINISFREMKEYERNCKN